MKILSFAFAMLFMSCSQLEYNQFFHTVSRAQVSPTYIDISTSSLQKMNLQGEVKLITTKYYSAKRILGKVIKSSSPPIAGGNVNNNQIRFNIQGMIEEQYLFKYGKNDYYSKEKFCYDKYTQLLTKTHLTYSDNAFEICYFYYGSDGRVIKINSVDSYSDENDVQTIQYSSNPGTATLTDPSNQYKIDFRFDSLNQVISYTGCYSLSTGIYSFTYLYQYDPNGNILSEEQIDNGESEYWKIVFHYDQNGNMTSKERVGINGEIIEKEKYEYKFDDHGNWLYQITYVLDHPWMIAEREIEYF